MVLKQSPEFYEYCHLLENDNTFLCSITPPLNSTFFDELHDPIFSGVYPVQFNANLHILYF